MAPVAPDHQVATTSTQITADVPTKTRKKRKIDPNGQTTLNIPTDNKFALLSDDDDEDDEMTSMTPQRQQSSQQPQDTNSQSQKSKKTNPIVVKNITSIEVQRYVTENARQKSTFKKTGSPSTKQFTIFPANLEEKKRIIKILTDKGYSHHTYTEKEDRRLSFVLAGVDFTEPSALKETLIANNIPAINVSFLSRNPDRPIYVVQFNKGSTTLNELTQIHRDLDGLLIKWSKMNPAKRRPVQCKRCQNWGHSASNCNHQRRCVKCAETHKPGECKREPGIKDNMVFCVNCQEAGHPSNAPTCKFFIEHKNKIQQTLNKRRLQSQGHHHQQQFSQVKNVNFPPLPSSSGPSAPNTGINYDHVKENMKHTNPGRNLHIHSEPRIDLLSDASQLTNEFNAISGIQETLKLYSQYIRELKAAKTQMDRFNIIQKYEAMPCI